jgi:hypothetical protein
MRSLGTHSRGGGALLALLARAWYLWRKPGNPSIVPRETSGECNRRIAVLHDIDFGTSGRAKSFQKNTPRAT